MQNEIDAIKQQFECEYNQLLENYEEKSNECEEIGKQQNVLINEIQIQNEEHDLVCKKYKNEIKELKDNQENNISNEKSKIQLRNKTFEDKILECEKMLKDMT